jgi:heat shock protein HslJ
MLILGLTACQGPVNQAPVPVNDTTAAMAAVIKIPDTTTLAGQWYLQPVLASDTATGRVPFLQFDPVKTHFSGNTGCNPMGGMFWFSKNDSSLSFNDKMITTKMACPGYDEHSFLQSLMHVNHYRLEKGMLILLSDNTELSRWTRKPPVMAKSGKA